jgi:hypothetical protein
MSCGRLLPETIIFVSLRAERLPRQSDSEGRIAAESVPPSKEERNLSVFPLR